MRRISPLAAMALVAAVAGCSSKPASQPRFGVTINGRTWQAEIAETEGARYRGLSDRLNIPTGTGMLFVYPRPRVLDFCMRKCLAPLDIAFLDANAVVVNVRTMRVEPYGQEEEVYSSLVPAQYALEVAGGELERAGVKQGDKATFGGNLDANKAE
jgi:uncharacterized protein